MRTLGLALLALLGFASATRAQSAYSCPSGESFQLILHATTDPKENHAILLMPGKPPLHLRQVVSASGARYSDGFTILSTKGNEATLESGAATLKGCTTSVRTSALSGNWTLAELRGKAVSLQRAPFIEFAPQGNRAAGFAGCNRFSSSYVLSGASLTFRAAVATRMACVGDAMTIEDSFLKMLSEVASHQLSGGELRLLSSGGQTLAVLRRQ